MDAFYASVEQRDFPELRGKAIAVGGGSQRGVVTTASYEAREYGVRSAMPGWKAKQLCPQLIFVPLRPKVYSEASQKVRAVFRQYTDLIEPLSLDEAFLDVTENKKGISSPTQVAQEIMKAIYEETQLTCSAGVSYCKFLAKIASDLNKPNGLTIIKAHAAEAFLEELPIEKFFGIGKVTAEKMKKLGIHKGLDLKKWSKIDLAKRFGKHGIFYYDIVRGIDNRAVKPHRKRKSLGVERTMNEDISDLEKIKEIFMPIIEKCFYRLSKNENFGRTITLKIKSADFQTITRSKTFDYYIDQEEELKKIALELLEENQDSFDKIRLIGLAASNLQKAVDAPEYIQLKFDF
jgi:DNA polymerase-4